MGRLVDFGGGDQFAVRRQDGAGEIVTLVDHRREGGADHGGPHLAHIRGQRLADQRQSDGVDLHSPLPKR